MPRKFGKGRKSAPPPTVTLGNEQANVGSTAPTNTSLGLFYALSTSETTLGSIGVTLSKPSIVAVVAFVVIFSASTGYTFDFYLKLDSTVKDSKNVTGVGGYLFRMLSFSGKLQPGSYTISITATCSNTLGRASGGLKAIIVN